MTQLRPRYCIRESVHFNKPTMTVFGRGQTAPELQKSREVPALCGAALRNSVRQLPPHIDALCKRSWPCLCCRCCSTTAPPRSARCPAPPAGRQPRWRRASLRAGARRWAGGASRHGTAPVPWATGTPSPPSGQHGGGGGAGTSLRGRSPAALARPAGPAVLRGAAALRCAALRQGLPRRLSGGFKCAAHSRWFEVRGSGGRGRGAPFPFQERWGRWRRARPLLPAAPRLFLTLPGFR